MGSKSKLLTASVVAAAALTLAACGAGAGTAGSNPAAPGGTGGQSSSGGSQSSNGGGSSSSSGGGATTTKYPTLTLAGSDSGLYTNNWNPLVPDSTGVGGEDESFVYEPLIQFDNLSPTKYYKWLAESYQWSNGDKTLTFDLHHGVKWNDGKPFTSADVVFTFNYLKKFPALNQNGITFSSIKAEGPYKVVMTFAKPAFGQLTWIAGRTPMLPEHIWSKVKNPTTFADTNPVGTGPFMEGSFSTQEPTLVRNPHYWQPGLPKVGKIDLTEYDGNDSAEPHLLSGDVDWAGYFEPGLEKTFVKPDPQQHHLFQPAVGFDTLVPNVTEPALADVKVRRAISLALNRNTIRVGESDYAAAATSPTGIMTPNDANQIAPQYKNLKYTYNPAGAEKLLESDGYTKDSKGFFAKDGKELSFSIIDPTAFSNYITEAQVIAQNLKAVGINATVKGESIGAWTSDIADGHFDLTVHWAEDDTQPFDNFDGWLDYRLAGPIGKTATWDFGRWDDPTTQKLLQDYINAGSDTARTQALYGLEKIMVTELPVIPMVYIPAFGEDTTTHFTGWPTAANPYEPLQPVFPQAEVVVLHLTPVSS